MAKNTDKRQGAGVICGERCSHSLWHHAVAYCCLHTVLQCHHSVQILWYVDDALHAVAYLLECVHYWQCEGGNSVGQCEGYFGLTYCNSTIAATRLQLSIDFW